MDYDQSGIATTYDEARALTPARRRHWQRLLSVHIDRTAISLVLDLGCGTGRFSEMLAAELGARVIGLDPSEKMIDQARRKSATSAVVFGGLRYFCSPHHQDSALHPFIVQLERAAGFVRDDTVDA